MAEEVERVVHEPEGLWFDPQLLHSEVSLVKKLYPANNLFDNYYETE